MHIRKAEPEILPKEVQTPEQPITQSLLAQVFASAVTIVKPTPIAVIP
jgi:hypothetical protein